MLDKVTRRLPKSAYIFFPQNSVTKRIFMRIIYQAIIPLIILATIGCGSGGGNSTSPDILENGLLGARTGVVNLSENGCALYREIPVTEIGFGHLITAQVVGNDSLNITFNDNGYVCNALNFSRYGGRFDANCGIQPLANFLPGYSCTQELVWSYSEPTSGNQDSTADVVRTAHVKCAKGDTENFACIVEYQGTAFDCISRLGICQNLS